MAIAPALNQTVLNELQKYDPALYFEWNNKISRWQVMRRSKNQAFNVFTVCNPDESYRAPDMRLVHYIVNCDGWKHKNAMEVEREIRKFEEDKRLKAEASFADRISRISKHCRKAVARDFC